MRSVTLKIDGKVIQASESTTIMEAAKQNDILIPSLCHHPDLPPGASCRLCLVEIKGCKNPVTSCNTEVAEGMSIVTDSPNLSALRRTNLELIHGEHNPRCLDCARNTNCSLRSLSTQFEASPDRFNYRKKDPKRLKFDGVMHLDTDKCIECGNCVAACQLQNIDYLVMSGNGESTKVVTKKESPCVSCGQCAMRCPVGAIDADSSIDKVRAVIGNKRKKVIMQFAPSIRASIGEPFGLPPGSIVTGQLIASLRRLGADWVVDVTHGADLTTVAEAQELKERLEEGKHLPMFTACCPAWVNYVETRRPDLTGNLTTVRSPHIILGGILKHVFARRTGIDPYDIFVVSVMPCTAKKGEINRKELNYKGYPPVDAVLTTRELALLIRQQGINLAELPPEEPDSLLETESGSGAIYGASGGVMEAALRSAHRFVTGHEMTSLNFNEVRGIKGIKEASVRLGSHSLKVAVVNGLGNIDRILDKLAADPCAYDYIEVMSCPGGCIGGGGQPIPTDDSIRTLRQKALYAIDSRNEVRLAHANPVIRDLYKNELKDLRRRKALIETSYKPHRSQPTKLENLNTTKRNLNKGATCPQFPSQHPGA